MGGGCDQPVRRRMAVGRSGGGKVMGDRPRDAGTETRRGPGKGPQTREGTGVDAAAQTVNKPTEATEKTPAGRAPRGSPRVDSGWSSQENGEQVLRALKALQSLRCSLQIQLSHRCREPHFS